MQVTGFREHECKMVFEGLYHMNKRPSTSFSFSFRRSWTGSYPKSDGKIEFENNCAYKWNLMMAPLDHLTI